MKSRFASVVLLLLAACTPRAVSAQVAVPADSLRPPTAGYVQVVRLLDGTMHVGRIRDVRPADVAFETSVATITIPIANIRSIRQVPESRLRNGQYWFPSVQETRLFFAPTGRMLEEGQGYFADHWLFLPSIAYGVSDRVTLGGGLSLIPGVGLDDQLLFFTPKFAALASPRAHIAVGALLARIPVDDDPFAAGILYGVGTFGGPDASVTAGVGYGFARDELADKPMVVLGGDVRVSRRLALVTENWIFPGVDDPLVSYGVRFLGEKISVDLAFATPLSSEGFFPGFPLVGFAVAF